MKRRIKSQGAEYVKKLKHSLLMWDVDGVQKLL